MNARIQGTGLAHRSPDTFENRLSDVMAIGAVLQVDVQGEPALRRINLLENSCTSSDGKLVPMREPGKVAW